ncbi:MAG: serine hydrolase domain-containing protein [Granulosicoccus sp.]
MYKALIGFTLLGFSFCVCANEIASVQYFEHKGFTESSAIGEGVNADTPFAIASVGKTMTSVALLRLVERGKLTLDDDATNWLPVSVVSGFSGLNGVTVRHLLAMTSGLPDYYVDDYIVDAMDDPDSVQTPLAALRYAYDEDVLFEPGVEFDYSNTNYVLAGLIAEAASGLSYAALMQQEVFAPAGMKLSFVFGSQPLPSDFPNGHEGGVHERTYYEYQGFGDGGVISTANDLAAFYRALFVEDTLLSSELMEDFTYDETGAGYGLGIEVGDTVFGHSGGDIGFSSDVRIDTSTGAIAIYFKAASGADLSWTADVLETVVE